MNSRKARIQELSSDVQRAPDPIAFSMKELVGLLLEEAKENLIITRGEDLFRMQGEAQALSRLMTAMTKPLMNIKAQEQ